VVKEKETCTLIDAAISGDKNVNKKDSEKIPKCNKTGNVL
jgi:hypothetical protein